MPPTEQLQITPTDVAALRRELADWYGSHQGRQFYHQAILMGSQPIRPAGPAAQVAQQLAAAEARRLTDADLWFIDSDLCALTSAAFPTMPPFVPRPHDLPSRSGFAVFAEPIAVYSGEEVRGNEFVDQLTAAGDGGFRETSDRLHAEPVSIIAVSWGPLPRTTVASWRAGGVWMSFFTRSNIDAAGLDEDTRRRARALLPPLTVDNEAVFAWQPDGEDPAPYRLHGGPGQDGTASWGRLVLATFQLAAQANLAEQEQERTPRPERRRTERAGMPARDVRVVRLRRSVAAARDAEAGPGDAGGREWRHRWIVRGHWRQHWYPSIADRRPLWIAPYLKGPDDAPLLGGDKVTIAGAPPPGPTAEPLAED